MNRLSSDSLYAVVLAGGAGTRFWPASRRGRPKQFLPILGGQTMIELTLDRLDGLVPPDRRFVVTDVTGTRFVRELELDLPEENVLTEPSARDTAPAILWSAIKIAAREPDARMLILPADHAIRPPEQFRTMVETGDRFVREQGGLLTFGIRPTKAHTGYGYIECGEPVGDLVHAVEGFVEKPDREVARGYVASGNYFWNSGLFLWQANEVLEEFRRQWPEVGPVLDRIAASLGEAGEGEVLTAAYEELPKTSIDYGLMEKADRVFLLPVEFEWDDVGSWAALPNHRKPDGQGNVVLGRHVGFDCRDTIVYAEEGHLVAMLGVEDLVIIGTKDATLVCPRSRAEEVKQLVERLRNEGEEDRT